MLTFVIINTAVIVGHALPKAANHGLLLPRVEIYICLSLFEPQACIFVYMRSSAAIHRASIIHVTLNFPWTSSPLQSWRVLSGKDFVGNRLRWFQPCIVVARLNFLLVELLCENILLWGFRRDKWLLS